MSTTDGSRRRISDAWAISIAKLAKTLRAEGVGRYVDQKLGIEMELYPEPPKLPAELLGQSESGDPELTERESQFLGSGAEPPLLTELSKGHFRSTG